MRNMQCATRINMIDSVKFKLGLMDAFTSKNKRFLNNVISDSKSMSSFFYYISNSLNKRRYEQK